jgi:maltooligosyltrehalose trehalohydrolase
MHNFSVWAPNRTCIMVEVGGRERTLDLTTHDYWTSQVDDAEHGSDYLFYLDDDPHGYPDPRSCWQPYDVHGPSRIFDPERFQWTDSGFAAVPLSDAVIYELHVGTFTTEGTFVAAEARIQDLRALGVPHAELMPLNSFARRFGWGYDGVFLFAPHEAHAGPGPLRHFVNACHSQGLAVLIEVVYNHFGSVGNSTGQVGPY